MRPSKALFAGFEFDAQPARSNTEAADMARTNLIFDTGKPLSKGCDKFTLQSCPKPDF